MPGVKCCGPGGSFVGAGLGQSVRRVAPPATSAAADAPPISTVRRFSLPLSIPSCGEGSLVRSVGAASGLSEVILMGGSVFFPVTGDTAGMAGRGAGDAGNVGGTDCWMDRDVDGADGCGDGNVNGSDGCVNDDIDLIAAVLSDWNGADGCVDCPDDDCGGCAGETGG